MTIGTAHTIALWLQESAVTFTWQAIVAIIVGLFTIGAGIASLGLYIVKLLIRSSLLDNNERFKALLDDRLRVTVSEVVALNVGMLEKRIETLERKRGV